MWKALLLTTALAFQAPPGLEDEYARMQEGSPYWLVTVLVERSDGTPVPHAKVFCEGLWANSMETGEFYHEGYGFGYYADSRGAMVFAPWQDVTPILTCTSDRGGTASARVTPDARGQVMRIVVPD